MGDRQKEMEPNYESKTYIVAQDKKKFAFQYYRNYIVKCSEYSQYFIKLQHILVNC